MKYPLVSIIIATFNSGNRLNKALESIKRQTFLDWECIIVDGASNDNTVDVIHKYIQTDNRFKYISEPDNGIYDAFNKGWKMAQGKWIYYLGSDDYLTKDSFIHLLKYESQGYEVLSGGCWIHKIDGTVKKQMSIGFIGCHQAKLTLKSAIEKMGGFDMKYRIFADFDLYMRMESANFNVKNVNTMVAHFSMDGTSQQLSNIWKCNKEYRAIYKRNKRNYNIIQEFRYCVYTFLSIVYRRIMRTLKK